MFAHPQSSNTLHTDLSRFLLKIVKKKNPMPSEVQERDVRSISWAELQHRLSLDRQRVVSVVQLKGRFWIIFNLLT